MRWSPVSIAYIALLSICIFEAFVTGALRMQMTTLNNSATYKYQRNKRIFAIRHGASVANEKMQRPGNTWGEPTFVDDGEIDSPLSDLGRQQALQLRSILATNHGALLESIDLVLVSPLTRCIETFEIGVRPLLSPATPVVAMPLIAERVYTASDTGRTLAELASLYPSSLVDWTVAADQFGLEASWWYTTATDETPTDEKRKEWRPHGQGQKYATAGEPLDHFEKRMQRAQAMIFARPETSIVLISHWGVIRHWTGGMDAKNCELVELDEMVDASDNSHF
jgi:broad specificity phosphatase PhoE